MNQGLCEWLLRQAGTEPVEYAEDAGRFRCRGADGTLIERTEDGGLSISGPCGSTVLTLLSEVLRQSSLSAPERKPPAAESSPRPGKAGSKERRPA